MNETGINGKTETSPLLRLSELQKHFLNLLAQLGVEGDALAGTFLLMKDDVHEMEEMLLWMYDFHPDRDEINRELIRRMKARGSVSKNNMDIERKK